MDGKFILLFTVCRCNHKLDDCAGWVVPIHINCKKSFFQPQTLILLLNRGISLRLLN
uniref:Uncharacterized protein n=1 Tax=Octopus bimaculoides TaxID=37653 RepID=A0A0L8I5R9_OCTBM